MGKCDLSYRRPDGRRETISIQGDFFIGRMMLSDGPYLSILKGNGHVENVVHCPLSLSRLKISIEGEAQRSHCRFFWRGDRFMVQDMGSTNGTLLEGCPLEGWERGKPSEPVEVDDSSSLLLGKFKLTIEPTAEVKPKRVRSVKADVMSPILPGECLDLRTALVHSYGDISEKYHPELEILSW